MTDTLIRVCEERDELKTLLAEATALLERCREAVRDGGDDLDCLYDELCTELRLAAPGVTEDPAPGYAAACAAPEPSMYPDFNPSKHMFTRERIAELETAEAQLATERAAHEETKRALNFDRRELAAHWQAEVEAHSHTADALKLAIETLEELRVACEHYKVATGEARASLAAAEARVKALEEERDNLALDVEDLKEKNYE